MLAPWHFQISFASFQNLFDAIHQIGTDIQSRPKWRTDQPISLYLTPYCKQGWKLLAWHPRHLLKIFKAHRGWILHAWCHQRHLRSLDKFSTLIEQFRKWKAVIMSSPSNESRVKFLKFHSKTVWQHSSRAVFANQFGIARLPKTWIKVHKLCEAILCNSVLPWSCQKWFVHYKT